MSKLADRLKKQNRDSRLKIESFTAISDMPTNGIWDDIKNLYGPQNTTQTDRFLATLLNGIATEGKAEFLLSKRIFSDMLAADPNVTRGEVNQSEFNSFMAIQKKNKVIACIKLPTKGKMEAGIYRLVDLEILEHLGLTNSSSQPSSQMSSQSTSSKTSPEDEDEAESESEADNEKESNKYPISIVQNRPSGAGSSDSNMDSINTLTQLQEMKDQLESLEMILRIGDESVREQVFNLREEIDRKQKSLNVIMN